MKLTTHSFLLVTMLLLAGMLHAQAGIKVVAEKKAIMLGEPLQLEITIRSSGPLNPVIGDTLGRFEVLEKKPLTTSGNEGNTVSRQLIVVTSFDSGVQRIPPIAIEGDPNVVSEGVDITVNTLPADANTKYGDIKQIIPLQPPSQTPFIAGLAIATLLSAFGIYWLNRKAWQPAVFAEGPTLPEAIVPASTLLQQLETLRKSWEANLVDSVTLGNGLMEIFRRHLLRKNVYSTSKTGEELVMATRTMYPAESWQRIVQTIRLCNAMRFGKYRASMAEGIDGIDAFAAAINEPKAKPATL